MVLGVCRIFLQEHEVLMTAVSDMEKLARKSDAETWVTYLFTIWQ